MIINKETLDEIIERLSSDIEETEADSNASNDDENSKLEKYQRQTTAEER